MLLLCTRIILALWFVHTRANGSAVWQGVFWRLSAIFMKAVEKKSMPDFQPSKSISWPEPAPDSINPPRMRGNPNSCKCKSFPALSGELALKRPSFRSGGDAGVNEISAKIETYRATKVKWVKWVKNESQIRFFLVFFNHMMKSTSDRWSTPLTTHQ